MTPEQIREARRTLGLTLAGLAHALKMEKNGARRVRDWESGALPITGPASVAIGLMIEKHNAINRAPVRIDTTDFID